jgi:plasmid stabilization system protein ParE
MRVRFTPQGRKQYFAALRYIRSKSPAAADSFQRRAEAAVVQLRKHPRSGHAISEFPDLPHSELPVKPYRFFHRIVGSTVWIVGVWHARQLPDRPDEPPRV